MNTSTYVYRYHDALYANITNRCPNACKFCIKVKWKMKYREYNLSLHDGEPSPEDVLSAFRKEMAKQPAAEFVFCGYGESTCRLEEMVTIARGVRAYAREHNLPMKIRLNTVGLGSLVWGRDISPDLKGVIDSVHISLNTADESQWLELVRPQAQYKEKGFQAVKDFIAACAKVIPETVVTAVENPGVDLGGVKKVAESLGAHFRPRPYLDSYEES